MDLTSILDDLCGPGRWGGRRGAFQAEGAMGEGQGTANGVRKGSSYQVRR